MATQRVVVTGLGLIGPTGDTVATSWENIRNGVSGIDWLKTIDTNLIDVKIGGEVKDYDPEKYFDKRMSKRLDRAQQFALIAAKEALDDSGYIVTDDNAYEVGCVIGTGIGSIATTVEATLSYEQRGQRGVRVHMVPQLLDDQIASQVALDYNLRGPNYTLITACATGNNAIGDAADLIRMGRATVMLAGGSEACLIPEVLSGYSNLRALGHVGEDNDPRTVSRPFDATRAGFAAGEGAGILVLEDLEHALERGATIYAEVTGYGHTTDAYHVTAPRPTGEAAARAMQQALNEAGLQPNQLSYINAHGTGTPLNDKSETAAVKVALGEDAYHIPMSSTKSMTGHMQGAAGAAEAIFCIMAMRDNFAPPTINLHNPDPECDLDYIPNEGREVEINHTMSNAFGFGGHNIVVVMSRYTD